MKTVLLCFSPTHTTLRVLRAIAAGTGLPCTEYDLTLPGQRAAFLREPPSFDRETLVLLGAPVYAGHVLKLFGAAVSACRGCGAPAVTVCLYGNRCYDEAVLDLYDLSVNAGFVPFAAAAFVGEHSFTAAVGTGRPNADDRAGAERFGRALLKKVGTCGPLSRDRVPFVARDNGLVGSHRSSLSVVSGPTVRADLCTHCGACIDACPMGVLSAAAGGLPVCAARGCLKCRACARVCPGQAIDFFQPEFLATAAGCVKAFGSPAKKNITVLA